MVQTDKPQGSPGGERPHGPPPEFASFFHVTYRELLRIAMYVGATRQEGEDAVMATMEDLLCRWTSVRDRFAYARRAVVSNVLKEKTRGPDRVRRRQIERGDFVREACEDRRLNAWEDWQWVGQMLGSLPPAQRRALTFIIVGFTPTEIARLFGKTPEAVRQSLCEARRRLTTALQQEHASEQSGRRIRSPREEAR